MFRTLRKAAESLERSVDLAFASGTPTDGRHMNTVLRIGSLSLRLSEVIAEGGFSLVYLAEPVNGPYHVRFAVKAISVIDDESRRRAQAEADLLASLPPHPCVVAYYGSVVEQTHAFLAFEMLDGGSLAENLNRRAAMRPSAKEALGIMYDAASAVAHLHAQQPEPIACRDVKLENLLYDRLQKRYKLCDLGSCTSVAKWYTDRQELMELEEEVKEHCSAPYRSPELSDVYAKQFVCEKVDVWSLGCVFYAILYGKLPFTGQTTLPIVQAKFSIPSTPVYPEAFSKLISAMLTPAAAARADVFTILEALARLRGVEMEPGLRASGAALRARRQQNWDAAAAAAGKFPIGLRSGVALNEAGNVGVASSAKNLNSTTPGQNVRAVTAPFPRHYAAAGPQAAPAPGFPLANATERPGVRAVENGVGLVTGGDREDDWGWANFDDHSASVSVAGESGATGVRVVEEETAWIGLRESGQRRQRGVGGGDSVWKSADPMQVGGEGIITEKGRKQEVVGSGKKAGRADATKMASKSADCVFAELLPSDFGK